MSRTEREHPRYAHEVAVTFRVGTQVDRGPHAQRLARRAVREPRRRDRRSAPISTSTSCSCSMTSCSPRRCACPPASRGARRSTTRTRSVSSFQPLDAEPRELPDAVPALPRRRARTEAAAAPSDARRPVPLATRKPRCAGSLDRLEVPDCDAPESHVRRTSCHCAVCGVAPAKLDRSGDRGHRRVARRTRARVGEVIAALGRGGASRHELLVLDLDRAAVRARARPPGRPSRRSGGTE